MKLSAVMFTLVAAGLVAAAPTPQGDLSPPDGYGTDLPGDIKRSQGEDPLPPGSEPIAQPPSSNDNDKRGNVTPPDGYGTDLPGDIKRSQEGGPLEHGGKIQWGHGPVKTSNLDYPSPPKDN